MRGVCFAVTNLFSKWRFCFWCKGFVFVVTNLFLFSIWGVCFCCGGFTFVVRDFIYVNDWFLMCRNLLPLCRIWFSWKGFICFWCRFCFSCGGLVFFCQGLDYSFFMWRICFYRDNFVCVVTNSVSDVTHLFLKWQFCFWCKGFVFVGPIFLMWRFWFWCKEFVSVVTNLFLTEWRFYFWCEKFVFVETNLFQLMWQICFRPEEFCFAVGEFFFAVRELFLMCRICLFIVVDLVLLWGICFWYFVLFLLRGTCFC